VQKGAEALGILKEYEYELEVLQALLSQRRWRRGSRGAWHDRRALILMTHLKVREHSAQMALDAVIEGLQDGDTHISESQGFLYI
jgi:Fanconi-associated nuclease 1